jgi:hypothetical protein
MKVLEGQGRIRGDVLHVQIGVQGDYETLDVPMTDALAEYVEDEVDAGRTKLSLAGAGNHSDYVSVVVVERDVVTTTHVRQVMVPVASL